MLVLSFKVELFEPFFPFVCIRMAIELQLMPFDATVLHVNVTIVLILLELAPKLFQRLHDGVSLFGVMDVLGFPLRQLVANNFVRKRKGREQGDGKSK